MAYSDPGGASSSAITPHDSTDESREFRGVYVGSGGNVVIVTPGGTAVTFSNAVAGSIIPQRGIRVNSTGTSASSLVGLR